MRSSQTDGGAISANGAYSGEMALPSEVIIGSHTVSVGSMMVCRFESSA